MTECKQEVFEFQVHGGRKVTTDFCGGYLSSDGGAVFLRGVDLKMGLIERLAGCFSDEEDVLERILRHLGLWQEGVRVHSGTDPPGETTLDPWLDDPFPDYDTEPVMAFSAT